tara:strand:- start:69 stop:311 length:243 start_codon:yes stop_codon:yes gene_type:complete
MGIGKFLNVGNYKQMMQISRLSNSLDKHMLKRCAYCNKDMGSGDDMPVVEFIAHLAEYHTDKIDAKDIDIYKKMVKKVTN